MRRRTNCSPHLHTGVMGCIPALFILVGFCKIANAQNNPGISHTDNRETSLTLAQAIQIGLQRNPMVHAAQADIRAAGAETRSARSMLRPQLSANSYLAYGDSNNILTGAGNVMPQNYMLVPPQGYADQNLTLMTPLYTGGRLEQSVRAASERERATIADSSTVQAETALRIEDAYLRALLAAETVRAAEARLRAEEAMERNARALLEAGKGLQASLRRVQADLADARRMLTTAHNTEAKALLDLKGAMAVSLDSDLHLADTLTFVPETGTLDTYLTDAMRARPEILSIQARMAAASAQTRSTRAAQGPQVYGMAMADGYTSHPTGTKAGYTLGVALSFPLLDGGQRRADTAQASARQERALAEAKDTELKVGVEVRQAWLDLTTAAENYRTAQSALIAAQAAYEVIALRVENQKGLQVEQLDALAALTLARSNQAQALYDHAIAKARLRRATGKIANTGIENKRIDTQERRRP